MPENDIMILIDGDGFKKGAKMWLRSAVKEKLYTNEKNRNKSVTVYDLTEFFTWANNTFKI